MRNLTTEEIQTLENRQCICSDWNLIQVCETFSTKNICDVEFSGNIELGDFSETIEVAETGERFRCGISHAKIHNCQVGDNSLVQNARIANYNIGKNCVISNVSSLVTEKKATFGNGTVVHVLNESGGRDVKIFDKLSAHLAYILTLYRYRPKLIARIENAIDIYTKTQISDQGKIGNNVRIENCETICNLKVGDCATLKNVTELRNGTICSEKENATVIGNGTIARNFIVGKGSRIYDNVIIENCYIGESCEIGKQYSAVDSLFFCNSQLFHGEACAVFAGPYTTSHHKSTLLIGCMFSFYNAGSGTNQSNHMYKLGPIHQGILERGTKTGSDSYLMLEARTAPFSLILGHHEKHFDTSDFPFSYILSEENRSILIPGINLQTVGTQRDAKKWASRDKRNGTNNSDFIIFDLFNPYIVAKMLRGMQILFDIKKRETAVHVYKNVRIKDIFVGRGMEQYRAAIACYIGEKLVKRLSKKSDLNPTQKVENEWIDIAGLILPKNIVCRFLNEMEEKTTVSLDNFQTFFANAYRNYAEYEWAYVCSLMEKELGKTVYAFEKEDFLKLLEQYKQAFMQIGNAVFSDATKEFDASSLTSFGIDGNDDDIKRDAEQVRGTAETNSTLLQLKEKNNVQLAEIQSVIESLKN